MPEETEREAGREIRRYGREVVDLHWVVMVVYISLAIISLLLLRDWFWETFKIRGTEPIIATPDWGAMTHYVLAGLLLVLGLLHVLIHARQKDKPMLPKDLMADFQTTVHALRYTLFLSTWDEKGSAGKYRGNQRLTYVITFYVIALAAITGAIALSGLWDEMGTMLHVVTGIMVLLVSAFRIVYLFRKRDWIAWRSILLTGAMPAWYVRENHPRWYEELERGSKAPAKDMPGPPSAPEDTGGKTSPEAERPGTGTEATPPSRSNDTQKGLDP